MGVLVELFCLLAVSREFRTLCLQSFSVVLFAYLCYRFSACCELCRV